MSTRCARSGQLLRDLYRLTEAALHGGRSDEEGVRAHLAEIAGAAKEQLLKDIGGARAEVACARSHARARAIYRARTHPPAPPLCDARPAPAIRL